MEMDHALYCALLPYLTLRQILQMRQVHAAARAVIPVGTERIVVALCLNMDRKWHRRGVVEARLPLPDPVASDKWANKYGINGIYKGCRLTFNYMMFRGSTCSHYQTWGSAFGTQKKRMEAYMHVYACRITRDGRVIYYKHSRVTAFAYKSTPMWPKHRVSFTVAVRNDASHDMNIDFVAGHEAVCIKDVHS